MTTTSTEYLKEGRRKEKRKRRAAGVKSSVSVREKPQLQHRWPSFCSRRRFFLALKYCCFAKHFTSLGRKQRVAIFNSTRGEGSRAKRIIDRKCPDFHVALDMYPVIKVSSTNNLSDFLQILKSRSRVVSEFRSRVRFVPVKSQLSTR